MRKNISGQTRNILMMPEMEVTVRATPFTQNSICSVRSFRSSRSAVVFSFLSRSWSKWKFSANSLESIRSSIVQEDAKHWSCKLDGHDLCKAAYCVHRNLNFQFNFSQPEIKKAANNFFLRQTNIYLREGVKKKTVKKRSGWPLGLTQGWAGIPVPGHSQEWRPLIPVPKLFSEPFPYFPNISQHFQSVLREAINCEKKIVN